MQFKRLDVLRRYAGERVKLSILLTVLLQLNRVTLSVFLLYHINLLIAIANCYCIIIV